MSSTPPSKRQKITNLVGNDINIFNNSLVNHSNGMGSNGGIDEGLYSRQLYVYGAEGMKKLAVSDILLIGLDGLGLEIAKNIILAGVKSITLYDNTPLSRNDFSSHYYSSINDIGRPRSEVCSNALAKLNSHVWVKVLKKEVLTEADISSFYLVVIAQGLDEVWIEYGDICRKLGVKFIAASTCGLAGRIFVDSGEEHVVYDETGIDPPTLIIDRVDRSQQGVVICSESSQHRLETGDLVKFSGLKGMEELNENVRQITVIDKYSFGIGDTSKFSEYISGGTCRKIKQKKIVKSLPLKSSYDSPKFVLYDFKDEQNPQLLLCFRALSVFVKAYKRFPKPWNKTDAKTFVNFVIKFNDELKGTSAAVETVDQKLASIFACTCSGSCCPIQSVIGGFTAQEAMKICTGLFLPLNQWFIYNAYECLPFKNPNEYDMSVISEEDAEPDESRYSSQIAIFGRKFQAKLANLKYLIVGAGAIGCELVKNFAMMGVASSPNGKIIITDMDSIERSNLNRQFLFRTKDIGSMKSTVAAAAAKVMNSEVNIVAHCDRMGEETENIYDDDFFNGLDGVANALDNFEARSYMDSRCVYYRKPLLESGTLGTKGNIQVIIPFMTESYTSSNDPPDQSFPMCTLKNFPYKDEHTIQWGRDLLESLFIQPSSCLAQFLTSPKDYIDNALSQQSKAAELLGPLKKDLFIERPKCFKDCVRWARLKWEELFSNTIAQLLYNFPPDHRNSTGGLFWSGEKRCPHPLKFDPNCPTHVDFIVSAANLRALCFSILGVASIEKIIDMANQVNVPVFKPRSGVNIPENDSQLTSDENREFNAKEVASQLLTNKFFDLRINEMSFEKDDDSNFQIDFITAASNLRSSNYDIQQVDRLRVKLIAGKIIPAIATTTGLVGGLVSLELFKLVQEHKSPEFYKCGYADLALPYFSFFEPISAPKFDFIKGFFTLWDRIDIEEEMTLQQLLDHFKEHYELTITMLSRGHSLLYGDYMREKQKDRLSMTLTDIVTLIIKAKIPPHVNHLVLHACVAEIEEVPYIRYKIKK